MIGKVLNKVLGSRNDRVLKGALKIVEQVNALEPELQGLDDAALRGKTTEFRERLAKGETLDDLLPEAFACVREAAKRSLGMRHFDVQLIGGWVLHTGAIAEMVTGEGKTLVSSLSVYLNALSGNGAHVVTVNDYLARRDADWNRPIYEALGMTVGVIQAQMRAEHRIQEYKCDVTYGTNSEFGFDYLRDNMKVDKELQSQRGLVYAVIDEVDSILIDEARTPLIITGPADDYRGKYIEADAVVRKLKKDEHFEVKEKEHRCVLSEEGIARAEELAGVDFFESGETEWLHLLEQGLRAHHIYLKDTNYVVQNGEVIIVDEFTGRMMEGRRWSDGLHQAVEAKERIKPRAENQTLATITYQNFFKLYDKIAGMTGTALTEAAEFWSIYKLDVVSIPTNRPLRRIEGDDLIYATDKDKFQAIAEEIRQVHGEGRPILVGTTSIEKSEQLSAMLERRGVEHVVLNAKQHEREAHIIEHAGKQGAVTIATNMAGRGTDIKLREGVRERGGLHIIGTERHESRRIDNQLRGRAGRQGDPGSSQFFLSLSDDLMRKFAPPWVGRILGKLGLKGGEPIAHPMVTKAITRAQKRVEEYNFELRKNLLEYDEVMDIQRKEVYSMRNTLLEEDEVRQRQIIERFFLDTVRQRVDAAIGKQIPSAQRDPEELVRWFERHTGHALPDGVVESQDPNGTVDRLTEIAVKLWEGREREVGEKEMRALERYLLLTAIDVRWKDHLRSMDGLKTGIHLRAYGQTDPKVAYKVEGHRMFSEMLHQIRSEVTEQVLKVRFSKEIEEGPEDVYKGASEQPMPDQGTGVGGTGAAGAPPPGELPPEAGRTDGTPVGSEGSAPAKPIKREEPKVGRNDPCPCGSGRKYKKCCGEAS